MPRSIPPDALPALLKPDMTVFVQGATGEPLPLVAALKAAPEASAGVHYISCLLPGINRTDLAQINDSASLTGFFVAPEVAKSYAQGRFRHMPLHYSGIHAYLDRLPGTDLAIVQVAPPDLAGQCSLGPCVDFQPTMLAKARCIVAEVNARLPRCPGGPTLDYSRIDYAVESDRPMLQYVTGEIPPDLQRLGDNVAGLVQDGDTIQIGIGKVPAAILTRLNGKRALGLQGGMISDEVVDLVEAGVITGERKSIDRGLLVCGAALGTDKVYRWVDGRTDVLIKPVSYTHDPRVVSRVDRFVSLNSVLEVDLFAQANAEMLGNRMISGTGGLIDFVRSARMSKGGRSVLAVLSTAQGGKLSRIVPKIDAGGVVSCARADIDIVATEHGVADLRDKSVDERAAALVAVAAPQFRDSLAEAWQRLRGRPLGH